MGSGVGVSLAELDDALSLAGTLPFDRDGVEARVLVYLGALGVRRPRETSVLVEQVMKRVELRAALGQMGEPLEAAVEETHLLLDQWLVSELGLEGDPDALSAARAAVLGGDVPGWTARWAGLSSESLAGPIRAARVSAVPERAPLTMEPSPIQLCCHRAGLRLLARIGRLLGRRGRHSNPAG